MPERSRSAGYLCPRCGEVLPWFKMRGIASLRGYGNARLLFCCAECKAEWIAIREKDLREMPPLLGDMLEDGMMLLNASESDEGF